MLHSIRPSGRSLVTTCAPGLGLAVALLACESGRAAAPTGPAAEPDGIEVSVSRAVISAPRTWNSIVDVEVARTGNFTGAVDLSIEGLPPGVSGTFTTTTLTPAAARTRVNLEVDSTAAYGTYPVTVRATGAGVAPATAAISFEVPRPSFALSVSPTIAYTTYVHMITGDTYVAIGISVSVTRDSTMRVPITLSASGLPTGIEPSLPTTSIPPLLSVGYVPLTAYPTIAPGVYPVTITATALDAAPRSVTVNVVVPPR